MNINLTARFLLALLALNMLAGCSFLAMAPEDELAQRGQIETVQGNAEQGDNAKHRDKRGLLERFNRASFALNGKIDGAVLRPIAKSYEFLVSSAIRNGVSNFFSNLGDVTSAANGLLQGEVKGAGADLARVGVDTTIGVGGLADRATGLGLKEQKRDFGQTLATWGVPEGPYLLLPLLGPGTVRSQIGKIVDIFLYPLTYLNSGDTRSVLYGTKVVSDRAGYFRAEESLGVGKDGREITYEQLKSVYLQKRRAKISSKNGYDVKALEYEYGEDF